MSQKPPFEVEDYNCPESIYTNTLRDTKTGEAIAPLTVDQAISMKELLQLWYLDSQKL